LLFKLGNVEAMLAALGGQFRLKLLDQIIRLPQGGCGPKAKGEQTISD
jgi:hypothetical protein